VDEEQKASIFTYLTEIGVDAQKIWAELEEQVREMGQL